MAVKLPQQPLLQLESPMSAETTFAKKQTQVRALRSRQQLVVTVAIV